MSNYQNSTANLSVGGMHCAMCVKTVEKSLNALPGVSEASVNLASEKARVVFDPQKTSLADMQKAIENTGYQYLGSDLDDTGAVEKKTLTMN